MDKVFPISMEIKEDDQQGNLSGTMNYSDCNVRYEFVGKRSEKNWKIIELDTLLNVHSTIELTKINGHWSGLRINENKDHAIDVSISEKNNCNCQSFIQYKKLTNKADRVEVFSQESIHPIVFARHHNESKAQLDNRYLIHPKYISSATTFNNADWKEYKALKSEFSLATVSFSYCTEHVLFNSIAFDLNNSLSDSVHVFLNKERRKIIAQNQLIEKDQWIYRPYSLLNIDLWTAKLISGSIQIVDEINEHKNGFSFVYDLENNQFIDIENLIKSKDVFFDQTYHSTFPLGCSINNDGISWNRFFDPMKNEENEIVTWTSLKGKVERKFLSKMFND